jgi:hypothetical protein
VAQPATLAANTGWQTFFSLGGIAGILSLFWQVVREGLTFSRRPRLRILRLEPGRDIFDVDSRDRRFVTVQVKNLGRRFARGCVAQIEASSSPGRKDLRPLALHWADTPIEYTTTGARGVDIPPNGTWRLDVAFSRAGGKSAWLAEESALYGNYEADAELPVGDHLVTICVTFDDGNTARSTLQIKSSSSWSELTAAQA